MTMTQDRMTQVVAQPLNVHGHAAGDGAGLLLITMAICLLVAASLALLAEAYAGAGRRCHARPAHGQCLEEGKTRIRHRYTISAPVAGLLDRVELRAGASHRGGQDRACDDRGRVVGLPRSADRVQGEARARSAEAAKQLREAESGARQGGA